MRSLGSGRRPRGDTVETSAEWRWWRPVLTTADAGRLAADHMRHLGFCGVFLRSDHHDGGNVVAIDAVALATHRNDADVSDFVRRLQSAGGESAGEECPHRLVYTSFCADPSAAAGSQDGVSLFRFAPNGVVTAANDHARRLVTHPYSPPARHTRLGTLTFFGRQVRAAAWLDQLARIDADDAHATARAQVLVEALSLLRAAREPDASPSERRRDLARAEAILRASAGTLGTRLHPSRPILRT